MFRLHSRDGTRARDESDTKPRRRRRDAFTGTLPPLHLDAVERSAVPAKTAARAPPRPSRAARRTSPKLFVEPVIVGWHSSRSPRSTTPPTRASSTRTCTSGTEEVQQLLDEPDHNFFLGRVVGPAGHEEAEHRELDADVGELR